MSAQKKQGKAQDPRLEYLQSMGLDATAADLQAPQVTDIRHGGMSAFDWVGNTHEGFEYYRATDENSIQDAERRGFRKLPKDCGVRMRGCHTDAETIMVRTVEQAAAHNKAEQLRVDKLRTGSRSRALPMGGGVQLSETVARRVGQAPYEEALTHG